MASLLEPLSATVEIFWRSMLSQLARWRGCCRWCGSSHSSVPTRFNMGPYTLATNFPFSLVFVS